MAWNSRAMRDQAMRGRTFGNAPAPTSTPTVPPATGFGARPTMPRGPYRDDVPELYRDRAWAAGLHTDPGTIDRMKSASGYVEPAGTGRWGTAENRDVAVVMAETRGVPVPLSPGRECGNCAFFNGDYRSFQDRVPGGCRKLKVVVFGCGGCVLAQPFGAGATTAASAGAAANELGELSADSGGQIYQEPEHVDDLLRESRGQGYDDGYTKDGAKFSRREPAPMKPIPDLHQA